MKGSDIIKGYRLSLIRHGLTFANENGIYIGKTDLPLSDMGASELCSKLEEYEYPRVHRVYTSPLVRCTETAEILFPNTETCVVEDLRELDFGEFEGKSVHDLINLPEYKDWIKGGMESRPPCGESIAELCVRTYKAVHEILMDMMNDGITHAAVITHSGIISNMLSCFGIPKIDPKELQIPAGEGVEVIATAQMWQQSQAFEILGLVPYEKTSDSPEV